jgi:hypothetical protein
VRPFVPSITAKKIKLKLEEREENTFRNISGKNIPELGKVVSVPVPAVSCLLLYVL